MGSTGTSSHKSSGFSARRRKSFANKKFIWPSDKEIMEAQRKSDTDKSSFSRQSEKELYTKDTKIWIPKEDMVLCTRFLIIAHMGLAGHRGEKATWLKLKEYVWWEGMHEQVKEFVRNCLHCLSAKGGKRIPRPWGSTMHATRPNEILWFDYLYIGQSTEGFKYLLVLRCAFSHYVELVPVKNTDAGSTAKVLIDWLKHFGIVKYWGSDQGMHFLNEVMKEMAILLGAEHHFVTPYTPWTNALAERPNREILNALRTLCSESRLDFKQWPLICPAVQFSMMHAPRERLGGLTALQVMTNLTPSSPLQFCFAHEVQESTSIKYLDWERLKYCSQVGLRLDEFYKKMLNAIEK